MGGIWRELISLKAHLEGKRMPSDGLKRIHVWNENFLEVLPPADLRDAYFDTATNFEDATLGEEKFGSVTLVDVRWGGVNLSVVDWSVVKILGDERDAKKESSTKGQIKPPHFERQATEYEAAIRANRQSATVLRDQGIDEAADRFAYRGQILRKEVLWQQTGLQKTRLWQDLRNSGLGFSRHDSGRG